MVGRLRGWLLGGLGVVLAVAGCMMVLPLASAMAETAAPGWEVFGAFNPTDLSPNGTGALHVYVYDVGGASSEGEGPTLTNTFPAGLEAVEGEEPGGCTGTTTVTCQLGGIAPGPSPGELVIPVRVLGSASNEPKPVDDISLRGGGASGPADAKVPVVFSSSLAGFGFANADGWISNEDGKIAQQAGSHPYELTTVFAPNVADVEGYELPVGGEAEALDVNLPPGLVGEPGAVPKCTREQFDNGAEGKCPADTAIGVDEATVTGPSGAFTVYNLVPPPGVAAQFGFNFNGTHTFLDAKVRSGGDYGITEHVNVPQLKLLFNTITIWGVPGKETGAPQNSFLTLPTSCGAPPLFSEEFLGSWQEPEATPAPVSFPWHDNEGTPVGIKGCEKLVHFHPSISLAPDTSSSDSPAGLTATVGVPAGLNPDGLATSGLKETTVLLPEGMAINPGQATGLVACPPEDEGLPVEGGEKEAFDGPPSCPQASKIGTDEVSTPLLPNRLKGNVYILGSDPPNVQLLVAASGEGVNLKLLGEVHLNEATGQITTTFKGTPQDPGTPDAPLTEFVLSFSGGAQAALVTPSTCGVYRASSLFTPWSTPFVASALTESNFVIDGGPDGSGVAGCTGPLPFAPSMTAGATTDQAGGYTSFTTLLQRGDGQQRVKSLQFKAPEGLAGMISKVPLCEEPQAANGTCPASSQIGHTVVGAGPGPYPLFIPQAGAPPAPIYLTGPYKGAPFGLSIVVPIIAGPFNLGTEIVRGKIEVNPHTAQITVTTDPLPTIIKGVPADLRSIDAVIDRPEFMFNPTNCNPMSFTGTATSTEGATAPLESHFQVGSCQALKFAPNFKASTQAKTSRAGGASLTAKVVYPTGDLGANQATSQANIARVKVELPKRLPSRLTTLQKACPARIFEANPAGCPEGSIVGSASAVTPVLPVPLTGPAYFVSHGGEAFPSLIAVLQGDNVTIDLVGTTFISKKGITSSTFKEVPDVPVGTFELKLPEGPHSALAGNGNLCKGTMEMPTEFVGQNGAVLNQNTKLSVTGCPKTHKAKKAKTKKAKKTKKH